MAFERRTSLRGIILLLTGGILVTAVFVFGSIGYGAVRKSLRRTADNRLSSVAREFVALNEAGTTIWLQRMRDLASTPVVKSAAELQSLESEDALRALLSRLRSDTLSTFAVELRDAHGHLIMTDGRENGGVPAETATFTDSEYATPLRIVSGRVLFNRGVPIRDSGRIVGFLDEARTVSGASSSARSITDLVGTNAVLLAGNADGSLWTDLRGRLTRPPASSAPLRYLRDGQWRVSVTSRVPGTPWVLGLEFPEDTIYAPLHPVLWQLIVFGALVVLIAMLAAWRLTHSLTDPITSLTMAAESIAAGDLTQRRPVIKRADEIGRLSRAFSVMADSIRHSHDDLESQISARTRELEAALARLRETQDELVRKERLATLGQLSSSIGHELRNPLGVMTNALYYLETVLSDAPQRVKSHLSIIRGQISLSEAIVTDLLDYARTRPPQRSIVSATALIEGALARVRIPPNIHVERRVAVVPDVIVDPVQIGQILVNLFDNAVQAMDGNVGSLEVSTRSGGEDVLIEVADTGPGVEDEILDKIFEPLFTTKARGIGLGLSVSRSLARANDGDVTVSNRPGGGALFTLSVPATPNVSAGVTGVVHEGALTGVAGAA